MRKQAQLHNLLFLAAPFVKCTSALALFTENMMQFSKYCDDAVSTKQRSIYDVLYARLAPAEAQLAVGRGYIRDSRIPKPARILGRDGESYRNRFVSTLDTQDYVYLTLPILHMSHVFICFMILVIYCTGYCCCSRAISYEVELWLWDCGNSVCRAPSPHGTIVKEFETKTGGSAHNR